MTVDLCPWRRQCRTAAALNPVLKDFRVAWAALIQPIAAVVPETVPLQRETACKELVRPEVMWGKKNLWANRTASLPVMWPWFKAWNSQQFVWCSPFCKLLCRSIPKLESKVVCLMMFSSLFYTESSFLPHLFHGAVAGDGRHRAEFTEGFVP